MRLDDFYSDVFNIRNMTRHDNLRIIYVVYISIFSGFSDGLTDSSKPHKMLQTVILILYVGLQGLYMMVTFLCNLFTHLTPLHSWCRETCEMALICS